MSHNQNEEQCSHESSKFYGTPALCRFTQEQARLGQLLAFILTLALQTDEHRRKAVVALSEIDKTLSNAPATSDPLLEEQLSAIDKKGAIARLANYFPTIREMFVCRAVDNFLCYLTDLLAYVFKNRPETLRSGEQIRIDNVLEFDSMDDLVSFIADKKINELAYKSMSDLSDYFRDKLGFDLFENKEQRALVIEVISIRNLLVHARGVINERFLNACPNYKGNVGEVVILSTDTTFAAIDTLLLNARTIDARALEKYTMINASEFEFEDMFSRIRPKG